MKCSTALLSLYLFTAALLLASRAQDTSPAPQNITIVHAGSEQLPFHLKRAKENGLTQAELIETITQLAFYSRWPKAMSALTVAKNTFQPQPTPQPFGGQPLCSNLNPKTCHVFHEDP
jgi:alkylhydroperoxidase/carboxymuconolactone decarboxylase family protein YurZ